MRIIGGEYGGRKLTPLSGRDIRPTTDRMRETIFNILSHSPTSLVGANVLDLFAGTGAMGLEALSRGAAYATFFDKDKKALQLVKKNITLLKAEDNTTIRCISAPTLPPCNKPYDIIFIDPPYHLDLIPDVLCALEKNGYMSGECLIILEYYTSNILVLPDNFEIFKDKIYGDCHVSILRNKS